MRDMSKVFEEIHNAISDRKRQEGEFTSAEYAEYHGRTMPWAYRELRRAIAAGKLTSRKATVDGHSALLYKEVTES